MFNNLNKMFHEFPGRFWVIVLASFIDGIGGTMLFPFFALYITQKFNVGMTEAGIILGLFSIFGLVGNMTGGALTDKFGRKRLAIFGLVMSAFSTLSLGLVNNINILFPLAAFIGILTDIGGPARHAMIADILPEEQRPEGFGILRVAGNLAWIIGPTIGGFVANHNFFLLFVIDAIISSIVAIIFARFIPETKPEAKPGKQEETIWQTIVGYRVALKDGAYMAFLVASLLMAIVYQQMYGSLSVFLRDNHGISTQQYGYMLTSSAVVVVLLQFWVMRLIKKRPPFQMMAVGTFFYVIGFSMFGYVTTFILFVMAVVVITMGEMVVVPTSQALAANFAPEDMRGRYMAVYGLAWAIPSTFGPGAAGYILDNYNPNLLWYVGGALCLLSVFGFYILHLRIGKQTRFISKDEPASAPAAD
jgi:MFS family permease